MRSRRSSASAAGRSTGRCKAHRARLGLSFPPDTMTVSDLIDLEAQLGRDRDGDPAALEARDGALVSRESLPAGARRSAILERWLSALRSSEPGSLHPGSTVARALRGIRAAGA